jgi:hypothetical protein
MVIIIKAMAVKFLVITVPTFPHTANRAETPVEMVAEATRLVWQ